MKTLKPNTQVTKSKKGFTILEVLLATAVFGFAIMAIVYSQTTSRRNIDKSQKIFQAVQLAQSKMVEMELKFQTAIDKNGVETSFAKENGAFEAPLENFKWEAELKESSLKMSAEELTKLLTSLGIEEDVVTAQVEQQKLVLTNLNKALKENYAELVVTIIWDDFGVPAKFPLVTHIMPTKPRIELTTNVDTE